MKNSHGINGRALAAALASLALLTLLLEASRGKAEKTAGQTAAASRIAPSPDVKAAMPAELARTIDDAIDTSGAASARWGVCVISLRDGRVLYARDADKPFTPASNMKVYTTAVALDLLGADYRWRTSVYAPTPPDATGTIAGDIVLYGRGAPDLASHPGRGRTSLAQLADDVYRIGVRRVRGNVMGDESYLRGEPLGDGWMWTDVQWYFGAEVSALSINDNEVAFDITPSRKAGEAAEIGSDNPASYFHVTNETHTVDRGSPTTIGVNRGLSDNELRIWGNFPAGARGFNLRISAHKPASWAALLFRHALEARGIVIEGDTHSVDAHAPGEGRLDPEKSTELAFASSKSLAEIVHATNKESINLDAELILRTLGKERGSMAPDPDPRKMAQRGDDEAGDAVVLVWLQRAGIATRNLALHDGSGLSRLDVVTPEATARLLGAIANTPVASSFRDSLPLAGEDGTLRSRLAGARGKIAAKTGTLTYDNSLSGYAVTAAGEPLAFSIMCNEQTGKTSSVTVIDRIAALLAAYGNPG
jgi:D-alanyl-D-alanine carboxypeptidase/D-alanyl-D-alanine-endopeptidase (penicillin-binding protein 4)